MDDDDEDIDDNLEENDDDDSVSDFDDDEDPDNIEIPVARDLLGASSKTPPASASSSKIPPKPALAPVKTSYANGKPLLSSLGVPILPVNTATTRVGGTTVARRGGLAGQPFTSESKLNPTQISSNPWISTFRNIFVWWSRRRSQSHGNGSPCSRTRSSADGQCEGTDDEVDSGESQLLD